MGKTVNIHTAKTALSKLLADVERGEEIVIARAGKPVAKLVAVKTKKSQARADRKPGFLKGKIRIGADFEQPLPEEILAGFRGKPR